MLPGPCRFQNFENSLEDDSSANDDSTVSTVCRPLVKESGCTSATFGNTEVASGECVEHIGAKLEANAFRDLRVFDDTEIDVFDVICTKNVSS